MEYRRSLFIFRRDLRVHDNAALIAALKSSQEVVALFIFDPRQIQQNTYFSTPCFQFMLEALEDLEEELKSRGGKLYFFSGKADEVIEKCVHQNKIEAVFLNRDYTPFSIARDKKIKNNLDVPIHFYDTLLLNPPGSVLKSDETPYTVFTPFYKASLQFEVPQPAKVPKENFYKGSLKGAISSPFKAESQTTLIVKGKRSEAQKILKRDFSNYKDERDFPGIHGTTRLSAFNKFSVLSPREVYHGIVQHTRNPEPLLRQLYWRDFFTHIAAFFPHVFGKSFRQEFDAVPWEKNNEAFKRWCQGETGFPIVDAGMRELNQTGYMHNRLRMITASFLTKDLHIHWRLGELYFAQHLTDYDPCVNNGSWQWAASTGCDAQPYFRIFNPWLQQIKFDPECAYIKKWIPELKYFTPKEIHNWETAPQGADYPHPMCVHKEESVKAKERFKTALSPS